MHDLRAAVYRHLQRLSLAFFTQTRTGEVQSRIANDIGDVRPCVTSTATSIVSNVTTVLAATAAMFLLDWRLAVAALGLLPFFVWLTRRVGEELAASRGAPGPARRHVFAGRGTCRCRGALLGKTRAGRPSCGALRGESAALADLEVRVPHGGALANGIGADELCGHAGADLDPFAGPPSGGGRVPYDHAVAFTTLQTRLFFPVGVPALGGRGRPIARSPLVERVFHYLDLPVDIEERDGAVALRRGTGIRERSPSRASASAAADGPRTLQDIDLEASARDDPRAVGETGSGKEDPCLPAGARPDADVDEGRVAIDGVDVET